MAEETPEAKPEKVKPALDKIEICIALLMVLVLGMRLAQWLGGLDHGD